MTAEPIFELSPGHSPLLVSFPHIGTGLWPGMRLTAAAGALPDTDWVVDAAYPFLAALGAGTLRAHLSRFVVDLNRPSDDAPMYPGQAGTGLFPTELFDGQPIYADGHQPTAAERQARIAACWQPYHEALAAELARLKAIHGYALLWEAHSIDPVLPRLFSGRLPDINLGSNNGAACLPAVAQAVLQAGQTAGQAAGFSAVLDGRFKGGHITRHYGRPADRVLALQLELSQSAYLADRAQADGSRVADPERLARIAPVLRELVTTFLAEAAQWAGAPTV